MSAIFQFLVGSIKSPWMLLIFTTAVRHKMNGVLYGIAIISMSIHSLELLLMVLCLLKIEGLLFLNLQIFARLNTVELSRLTKFPYLLMGVDWNNFNGLLQISFVSMLRHNKKIVIRLADRCRCIAFWNKTSWMCAHSGHICSMSNLLTWTKVNEFACLNVTS